jgi:glycosyltransferase involved in cell wall biosynthesis
MPETMVLEIIESVAGWPPGPVLVVHGSPGRGYRLLLEAAAARFPGRVVFSSAIVPPERVDELFASAAVGLALYRPDDDNLRCVGHAAGKIFNLMKVGVPAIANDLPGLRELLEGNGCGLVVDGPEGIGRALGRLLARRAQSSAACRAAFPRFEFERNYREVVRRTAPLL